MKTIIILALTLMTSSAFAMNLNCKLKDSLSDRHPPAPEVVKTVVVHPDEKVTINGRNGKCTFEHYIASLGIKVRDMRTNGVSAASSTNIWNVPKVDVYLGAMVPGMEYGELACSCTSN